MTASELILDITDAVGTLTLNRPQALNALNLELLSELKSKLLHQDRALKLLFIRGAGGKAFAAGADIRWMAEASAEELATFIDLGQEVMRLLEARPYPVIAVIDGFALGGGLELALACDCILATDRAKVGLPEVGLGVVPGFGGTQRLIRRVGVGQAKRLTLTGEIVTADEGYRLGLFDWLIPADAVESKVSAIRDSIVKNGPLALRQAKRLIDRADDSGRFSSLRDERDSFIQLAGTADGKEGMSAFLQKRGANFTGN